MSVETASGRLEHQAAGYARAASIGEPASCPCIDCATHESSSRRMLAVLLGAQGLVGAGVAGERRGARDRRQGRPADPRVAVQLDGGDRAGRVVRGALDDVDAPAAAAAPGCAGWSRCRLPWNGLRASLGVALFALVIYSGFDGAQVTQANFSVTFIYVIFWVGHAGRERAVRRRLRARSTRGARAARLLAALARAVRRGRPRRPPLRYPQWLGVWPAVAVIVGFAWLELVYVESDHPATLAALSLAYFLAMLAGDGAVRGRGVERAGRRLRRVLQPALASCRRSCADEDGAVYLRRPLSGVTDLQSARARSR